MWKLTLSIGETEAEGLKFETSLGYISRPYLKRKLKRRRRIRKKKENKKEEGGGRERKKMRRRRKRRKLGKREEFCFK
jgi:hypothetical protein